MSLALRLGRRLPPRAIRLLNLARGIEVPALVDRPPGHRVAVVAPHPDDELLGCGGTLCKHLDAGDDVSIVFVTSGERTAALSLHAKEQRVSRREAEAAAAAATLGLGPDRLMFLRYPDGGVAAGRPAATSLAQALQGLAPDLVYVPFPYEAHADHVAAAQLVAGALATVRSVRTISLYEVWTPLCPNTVVDVTEHFQRKIDALACYTSAIQSVDYTHTARGLAAYRSGAGLHGVGYAEAFLVIDPAGLDQLLS